MKRAGDLRVLGRVVMALNRGSGGLQQRLERSLETLRRALKADAVELFLADPGGSEVMLAACRGDPLDPFLERVRFAAGEGYPGWVASRRKPLATRSLPEDSRYLREQVKRAGFRCYASVPLEDGVGALQAAWKSDRAPLRRAMRLLKAAAGPLSAAVQAVFYRLGREPVEGFTLRERLRHLAERARRIAGADTATAWLQPRRGALMSATAGFPESEACSVPPRGRCPCMEEGRAVVLRGGPGEWPEPCRGRERGGGLCLPLRLSEGIRGAVTLSWADPPELPTCHLPLLAVALGRPAAEGEGLPVEAGGGSLEVRCFGPFEVVLEGRTLPPERFRRRMALTLLQVLLLHEGRPVSREALCELLWPGAKREAAANRLHGVVHSLRAALGPEWVATRGEGYAFDRRSPHRVDLFRFRDLLARARRSPPEEEIALLEEACALYRGDLFQEIPSATWCREERKACREAFLGALKRLAALLTPRDPERSRELYRRALQMAEERERPAEPPQH